ncbi:MAG: molybdopterin molybdotransferase MoeA [Desulfohalobiaceae bacterium]
MALGPGLRLRPQEVGLLAALGQVEVEVYRRPRVCVLSTGDELVPPHQTPLPGQIRDVNSHTVAALAAATGAEILQSGIVPDDLDALVSALGRGLERADVVFLSGGSSVGVRDLTIQALDRLPDAEILVHGVAISPGKPTIVARVGSQCVFGLPGQVTSAQVVMLVLGEALLRHLEGEIPASGFSPLQGTTAVMARNVASRQGREDYIRVRLTRQETGPPLAHPLLGKSGLLRTLLQADGLVVIPAETEGLEQGETVLVRRL